MTWTEGRLTWNLNEIGVTSVNVMRRHNPSSSSLDVFDFGSIHLITGGFVVVVVCDFVVEECPAGWGIICIVHSITALTAIHFCNKSPICFFFLSVLFVCYSRRRMRNLHCRRPIVFPSVSSWEKGPTHPAWVPAGWIRRSAPSTTISPIINPSTI